MDKLEHPAKVICLDKAPVLLAALKRLLNGQPHFRVCWAGTDASMACKAIEQHRPALVTLDISLGQVDGLELVRHLNLTWPNLVIFVLSELGEAPVARCALKEGASAFVGKDQSPEVILDSVRQALKGEIVVSDPIKQQLPW